tara:strand:+ start:1499 stop:1630 length:132 start_codon:yes stop_codon:yes gene_type:complete
MKASEYLKTKKPRTNKKANLKEAIKGTSIEKLLKLKGVEIYEE